MVSTNRVDQELVGPPRWCWVVLWSLIAFTVSCGTLAIIVPH